MAFMILTIPVPLAALLQERWQIQPTEWPTGGRQLRHTDLFLGNPLPGWNFTPWEGALKGQTDHTHRHGAAHKLGAFTTLACPVPSQTPAVAQFYGSLRAAAEDKELANRNTVSDTIKAAGEDKLGPRVGMVIKNTQAALMAGFTPAAITMDIRMPIVNVQLSRARVNAQCQALVTFLQGACHLLGAYDPSQGGQDLHEVQPPMHVLQWKKTLWVSPYTRISHANDSDLCLHDLDKDGKLGWRLCPDGNSAALSPIHALLTSSTRLYHEHHLRKALCKNHHAA